MVSIGKIEKIEESTISGLAVDGLDVLAMSFERTDKTCDGYGLLLSTDAGDYLYEFWGDLKPNWALDSSDVLAGAGLLLSFVPFNYNL